MYLQNIVKIFENTDIQCSDSDFRSNLFRTKCLSGDKTDNHNYKQSIVLYPTHKNILSNHNHSLSTVPSPSLESPCGPGAKRIGPWPPACMC